MPPFRSVKNKGKVRWSKLYSFSCFRPQTNDDPIIQQYGGPGFSRTVFCNQSHFHKKSGSRSYPNNYVSTTRYNFVTFFPKALFEQFRRVANLYFLLSAILSFTPAAPFSSGSVIAPLVFVVGISMTKEALEDWHRFMQDIHVNSRLVKVHIGNGTFVKKPWKELHVGDVVQITKDQYFPSDLLLLSSSYDDGLCYVDTMNLDGETNLKYKRCLEVTLNLDSDMEFKDFKATIRCEDPNPNLYSFTGNLEYKNSVHALDSCQVLLRDSKLRNTEYIYGVVIFSGHETKAIQNSTKSPSKRSRIEKKMDYIIYLLFSTLLLLSLVSAIGTVVFVKFNLKHWWYLKPDRDLFFNVSNPGLSGLLQLIRTLILYGYLIPISLYVSIEMVKVLQAVLINTDGAMFDEETCKSTKARTSNLNEELGQVEIILSDKTGTLTCNQMEFRKCSIAGVSFGGEVTEVDIAASKRMNLDVLKFKEKSHDFDAEFEKHAFNFDEPDNPSDICIVAESSKLLQRPAAIKGFNFTDDRLMHMNWVEKPYASHITMFLKVLALCHTGIPIEQDTMGKFKYEAESPEEVAFLIAAQEFGFTFCQRTQSCIVVKELKVERQYSLLNLLEFSSSRKRMSVIVRDENDQIFLLSKGADSIIYDRLGEAGKHYCEATHAHLSDYAEDGLRTLAIAYRRIESDYYEKWNSIFTEAKTTVGPERDELLASASEMIEKDLILLGAVAIEDKLQKGVPECIDRLAQAGIKIWLLTGDKKETAINIGFSCSLLRHDMKQFHIGIESKLSCKNVMKEEMLAQIDTASKVISQCQDGMMPFALIIDGEALELALHSDVRNSFISLSVNCASVICCRVSPKQKALITRLVKKYTGMTTLAIGDGANDVGMIQEADIGVGISGMEGMQAVMASDFSLPKFHMLGRLLIVHGHWCYKRIAKMVLYFVYKNIAFGMTLFYYQLYTRFSGALLYDDWYMTLFNVVLTSLPVISLGVFDQDVSAEVCLQFPALYQQGQKNLYFSWTRIIGWIFNALFTSLGTFFLNIYIFVPTAFHDNGQVADAAHLGTIMYTCIICTVNCQIALIISHFTWIQHLFIWGSICLCYLFLMVYGSLPVSLSEKGFRHLSEALGPSSLYWLATLFIVAVCILPYFVHISIQRWFYPMDDHVIQEMMYCNKDATDRPMWIREQKNSNGKIHVGFTSRVDAKVKYWRDHFHEKKWKI